QLIVRDAHLSKKSRQRLNENAGLDMPFTEVKTEVVLDRITAQAVPRQLERVPQGVSFLLDLILNVYELDDEAQLLSYVFRGLDLVQNDYLGGKGTRGSGQVKIRIARVGYKTQETYESNKTWQDYTSVAIPSELELRTRKG
ncbi:MAG: type III-A CRISPR-associated RAMP protein Csm3, partial [Bacteroidota bacterium]